jgi:hypothetical protein
MTAGHIAAAGIGAATAMGVKTLRKRRSAESASNEDIDEEAFEEAVQEALNKARKQTKSRA